MPMASTFREESENARLSFERLQLLPMDITHHDEKGRYVSTGECAWRSWNEPATRLWTPDKEQALKACRVCCSRRPPEVARTKMTRSCVRVEWSPEGRGLSRFGKIGSQPLCGDCATTEGLARPISGVNLGVLDDDQHPIPPVPKGDLGSDDWEIMTVKEEPDRKRLEHRQSSDSSNESQAGSDSEAWELLTVKEEAEADEPNDEDTYKSTLDKHLHIDDEEAIRHWRADQMRQSKECTKCSKPTLSDVDTLKHPDGEGWYKGVSRRGDEPMCGSCATEAGLARLRTVDDSV